MELRCAVQPYAWGKLGRDSEVALLQESAHPDFCVEDDKPYAELWMGAHPTAPSLIKGTNEKLSDWITQNPAALGDEVIQKFGFQLPFLFKVLSVNKALSIQAHPNKQHAEQLHRDRPDLYKDPNHKPELAIALTPFEALCGFRPLHQIKAFLERIPELRAVVGDVAATNLYRDDGLRECFQALLTCPKQHVSQQLQSLLQRHSLLDESSRSDELAALVSRLSKEFPGDVGCFCVYFLNYITLKPGEALYLGPNEPHGYLKGDCIECMACSDNVVRAGLTPKYMDVDTLCKMLTYTCEEAEQKRFLPTSLDAFTQIFSPPVPDFAVAKIMIPVGTKNYKIGPCSSASIILIVSGEGYSEADLRLSRGTVVFVSAEKDFTVRSVESELLIFQSMANV